ncbi:hypothetical protein GIB67_012569 [Kingdonia uniflora]|uniref:Uncharacterized protein n=1 Tax=Kingdonia uniflora TaxID=39325 RepID=A0A7J7NFB4_9MAGN|nr:hypothetical protein GIB67_012569 [Kingdonia uniflora]
MSPRISFSYDLSQSDMIQEKIITNINTQRQDSSLMDSNNPDFDFNVTESFEEDSFIAADELFSEGRLIPLQNKKQHHPQQSQQHKPPTPPPKKDISREFMDKSCKTEEKHFSPLPSSSSKRFWGFKRSNSCGNGVHSMGLICSLPSLLRSKSTGSDTKNIEKTRSQKNLVSSTTTSKSSLGYPYLSNSSQKTQLKKNYGAYGDGVRISPVLNLPPPYNSKGNVNLFGLGSIFSNGKEKKNKKK